MSKFILLWMSLFSILPISIPYAYILSSGDDGEYNRLLWALGIFFANIVAGWIYIFFLDFMSNKLEQDKLIIKSIKPLGTDSPLIYLSYILPLFFSENNSVETSAIILAIALIWITGLSSNSLLFSPLLKICGLSFYEAELSDKRIITLVAKNKVDELNITLGVRISKFCYFGVINNGT